ncbi:MAG: hypothetical protein ACMUEM_04210 [Flavobacteriales bacterium AspAUS03]
MTDDTLQQINDHNSIEKLLKQSILNTLFSVLNFFIFGLVLAFYDLNIFWIFLISSVFYVIWVILFLKKNCKMNYKNSSQVGQDQIKVIELINGM